MMLDRANSGPEPSAEILRAIRHGVAAGACRVAARATGQALWGRKADKHSSKARAMLVHAAALSGPAAWTDARTSSVTPFPASLE